jgi:hypothetical protein
MGGDTMVRKRDLVIAVLITFCLTATLFLVKFTRSQPLGQYDPWLDINDDGKILIEDVAWVAKAFGTSGDPINKTALLIEVNATYASLLSQINELKTMIAQMNSTIVQLNDRVDILNMTGLGKPDFDSDWNNITAGQQITFNHNLGTTNVLVYMIGNDTSGTLYIHQIKYGGDTSVLTEYGARWQELTSTSITVIRAPSDPNWNYIRVMIWKIPT